MHTSYWHDNPELIKHETQLSQWDALAEGLLYAQLNLNGLFSRPTLDWTSAYICVESMKEMPETQFFRRWPICLENSRPQRRWSPKTETRQYWKHRSRRDETRRLSENPATETFKDISPADSNETRRYSKLGKRNLDSLFHYLLYLYNTNTCKQQKPSNTV